MKLHKAAIISILLFVFSNSIAEKINFTHTSANSGVYMGTVLSIAQDQHDLLWFATNDGIYRYDGYDFIVYRNNQKDDKSLLNDEARVIYVDHRNQLWIGSKEGLSRYNQELDNFDNFIFKNSVETPKQVFSLCELDKDNLLIGLDSGLAIFDTKNESFRNFESNIHLNTIIKSLVRRNDKVYIATPKGAYVYNVKNKNLAPLHSELNNLDVQIILPQTDTRIWIGSEGNGLYLLNLQTGSIKRYQHSETRSNSLSSNYIRSLALDNQLRLWIGTFNGLSIQNSDEDAFVNINHNPLNSYSLSHNSVRSIFKDNQGGIWLGTFYGGLNYYHPLKNQFAHIQHIPYTNSLNDKVISCIEEDRDGKMWIGTNDMGVNLYDPASNTFRYYNKENNPGLGSNNIKAFLLSKNGRDLFIGTHGGGLSVLNKQTGSIQQIQLPEEVDIENVYSLTYDHNGDIWIGTLSGLCRYNETSRKMEVFYQNELGKIQIMYLMKDSQNRLWIGTENSLYTHYIDEKRLKKWDDPLLSRISVNAIFEDSKKQIWIATRNGLFLHQNENEIIGYSYQDGLASNKVYGILEDGFSRLWLSTADGLSCFLPDKKEFHNYSIVDGLAFSQFNTYSFCHLKNGNMWFGGINGIVTFYPELLIDNPHTPTAYISRLLVLNKAVKPGDETKILSKNILDTKQIKISQKYNSFILELGVTNYLSNRHNTFAYMLEGFDKDWHYTTDNRQVTYSNLKYGKYRFRVKAANNDGKWNNDYSTIDIRILPKWYQTWMARLLFLLIAGAIVYTIYRFFNQRKLIQQQLFEERIDKEKMEEINQMKMRFFINISHEFRTPLTLILSPIQELLDRSSEKWQRSQLRYIEKNANKLLHLVNQLMDYRRAELGVFQLQASKISPTLKVNETFTLFEKYAKQKRINYNFLDQTDNKNYIVDEGYLELILNNLLSNAFKFTPEKGNITVRLEEDVEHLILEVEDSGIGISEKDIRLIFERFYQSDNQNSIGTGIGLSLVKRLVDLHHGHIDVNSKEGDGTRFTIFFPQNEEVYAKGEIVDEASKTKAESAGKKPDFILTESDEDTIEAVEKDEDTATLLVVEDDLEIRGYLVERLKKSYHVLQANNGVEALELIKEHDIDLIISDVMMPEMDGIRLTRTLKQNIRTCHVPLILLSAKANVEDQLQGLEVGADDYVPKPFTFSVLNIKIQNMLKSRRRMLEFYSNSLEVEPEKVTFNAMDEELLSKAKDIVFENLSNSEFTADVFSSEMGMSRSNLHLKLKAITGESTIDFIRKIRFNEACKLLLDGRYNVSEVSTMVGFNTPSYFATSFKNYFGYLPSEYIKNRRLKQN